MEAALARYAQTIRSAAGSGGHLRLSGGGTKDFYGGPLEGEPLDLREYAGIVSYEPSELVITARCGTPLAELEDALARSDQMIPFEPPRYGAGGTLGGCIAAGLAGPSRIARSHSARMRSPPALANSGSLAGVVNSARIAPSMSAPIACSPWSTEQ